MTVPQSPAKKHHFVPRSLLRHFRPSDAGADEFLFVFDKQKDTSFRTSLMNAASQNGFNTFEAEEGPVNFEGDFDQVDALLAERLREIHALRQVSGLSAEAKYDWSDLVAVQLLRTPIIRSTMTSFIENLADQVQSKFDAALHGLPFTENDARSVSRNLVRDREGAKRALAAKDLVLFEACGDAPFRISDRPVTLETSLPFGDMGLESRGVAVYLPLGKDLMIGMLCPSIGRKLLTAPIEALEIPSAPKARLIALRDGLETGAAIKLDDEMVRRHNALQIAGCMRFVYGPSDQFDDVRKILAANPTLRDVRSTLHFGEMGIGPGPRHSMPMGYWLVLQGQQYSHMLEVRDVTEHDPLEASVASLALLEVALRDGPFSEMQFYEDKHCVRGMRDVKLLRLEGDRVQVRHSDDGLHQLMTSIASRPRR